MRRSVLVSFIALTFLLSGTAFPQSRLTISSVETFGKELQEVPCDPKERLPSVRHLFEEIGATPADVSTMKRGKTENVVVEHKGTSDEIIVIGAHYDFVDRGCGAVDNWTGIVTIVHLYESTRQYTSNKTLLFTAFDQEEKGLLGSQAMANAIPKTQVSNYCAMINVDSFGMNTPFVIDNISSSKLTKLAQQMAKKMDIPLGTVRLGSASSDSASFIARKIPSLTLTGLAVGWDRILHTPNDQVKEIKPVSVYLGYRLVLAMLAEIDQAPCDAYR